MYKRRRKGRRRRTRQRCSLPQLETAIVCNFVPEAGPGCYIARREVTNSWLLEWEKIEPSDYDDVEDFPEIAIDAEEHTLTLCNVDFAVTKVAYITVFLDKGLSLQGRDGRFLNGANSTDNQGLTRSCVTFIVLCPPQVFCHLCFIVPPRQLKDCTCNLMDLIDIESDVQEWNRHINVDDTHAQKIAFPLLCSKQCQTSYLCTQGEGGHLTHFFAGNQHAIDFACPLGTPLLAVGDAVVVDVQDRNILSGIAVSNLFQWNSIMLRIDTPTEGEPLSNLSEASEESLYVEYVHIQAKSAKVKVGERVKRGQTIALSGSVGFSPEPHLHFCAYRSRVASAPTVRVFFAAANGDTFLPRAGIKYDANGPATSSH